jgi:hypothetical protein
LRGWREAEAVITKTAIAQPLFVRAAIRRLPSRPCRGNNHQLAQNAPAAAPTVLAAYNHPIVDAAPVIWRVMARARSGRDAPMKNVGQRRLTNRIPLVGTGPRPSGTTR